MSSSAVRSTRRISRAASLLERHPLATIVALWAFSRFCYFFVSLYVMRHYGRTFHLVIVEWDAALYDRIARLGFDLITDYVWPPALIFIIRAFHAIGIGAAPVGVVLSGASTLAGAIALYRLADERRGVGLFAAAAWLVAPFGVFNYVLYTEPPFCAFAFWAWERMRRGKWAQASVLCLFACSFRITGVFLIAAMAVWILTARSEHLAGFGSRLKAALWLLLPLAFYGGCELFLYLKFHDWMAWYHAQTKGWNRQLASPMDVVRFQWKKIQPGADRIDIGMAWTHRFEVISLFVGMAVTVVMLLRKRWGEAVYVGLQVLALGTSIELSAVNRGTLLWWPLWLLVGEALWKRRGDWLVQLCFWIACGGMCACWAWLYFMGLWAG